MRLRKKEHYVRQPSLFLLDASLLETKAFALRDGFGQQVFQLLSGGIAKEEELIEASVGHREAMEEYIEINKYHAFQVFQQ